MKKTDLKNLKEKTEQELKSQVTDLRKEINKLTLEMSLRKIKNVSAKRQKQKDIARILTLLNERKTQHGT